MLYMQYATEHKCAGGELSSQKPSPLHGFLTIHFQHYTVMNARRKWGIAAGDGTRAQVAKFSAAPTFAVKHEQ